MPNLIAAAALLVSGSAAQVPADALFPRAQTLVDDVAAHNAGVLDVLLHVSPSPEAANIVVAAHLRQANGERSGADDLGVMTTGAPLVEVQKDGRRLGVLVQLRDADRHVIGALGVMYRYAPGDDVEAQMRRSFAIRDALVARIRSRAALVATSATGKASA